MISRRDLIGHAVAAAGAGLPWPLAAAAGGRTIPQRASARVIVDNDFAGDPDSLVALAHQLLTPKTRTVLVTASALNRKLVGTVPVDRTAAAGREIAADLIRRLGLPGVPPVIAGSEVLAQPVASEAARAIVAEAMRSNPLPLVVTCGGPLTNVAAALRMEPRIATRMTLIWIGGRADPAGGWEYNLAADVPAARYVIEESRVLISQVPQEAYRQMQFSVAEFADRLRPISPFGAWLYDRFTTPPSFVDVGGSWPLGDSPTVLLSAISTESSRASDRPARRILPDLANGALIPGRTVRMYETLDARLTFEDFLALIRLHASRGDAA